MIEELVKECLLELGIEIIENDLSKSIEDSIQFISFVVELEEKFNIELPDEYLDMIHFQTLENVYGIINDILNN